MRAAILSLAVLLCSGASAEEKLLHVGEQKLDAASRKTIVYATSAYEAAGHPRLEKPKVGDWLWSFNEDGETPDEFRRARAPLDGKRRTIYLVPAKDLPDGVLEKVGPIVSAGLGLPWKISSRALNTDHALVPHRRQLDADPLLQELSQRVPEDAVAIVLVTRGDLFEGKLNFVFGVASPELRAGVFSVHRLDTTERLGHVVEHEVGHLLGLPHCIFYKCLMQGANSLREVAEQPIQLCPVCLEKLRHRVGFDPKKRAAEYARALEAAGLAREAEHAADALRAAHFSKH